MAKSRRAAFREIMRPWSAKLMVGIPFVLAIYQFGCDQFGFPTVPRLWGMTGAFFPWWGWLFVAQLGFILALIEYVRRQPEFDPAGEIASLTQRLARAEERLDGAKVVSAVGRASVSGKPETQTLEVPFFDNTASGKGGGLTQKEREKALNAMSEVMHFIGKELTPFQSRLSAAVGNGPSGVEAMDALELDRERLDETAGRLWHEHSYHLELVDIDIMPLLQTLGALRNPISDAAEAKGWPDRAIHDRLMDVNQPMSELGGHIGNIRNAISAKRKELEA